MAEEPIAIIGLAAQLPQDAVSPKAFWQMIVEGRNATTPVPKDRANMDAFWHPNPERTDTTNVSAGNFLREDISKFDAPFFSIQPLEAESMDPQQRLLLETSYKALENGTRVLPAQLILMLNAAAGASMESIAGSMAAVFVATSTRDYEVIMYRDSELTPKYMETGTGNALLANRISWYFDLRGPSVNLDTACSGSLTAVHLACQSLRSNESSMALVGGVSLIIAPEVNMNQLSTMGFLSPDGHSYSFDSRANGYAKGEGVAVVILKRLSDALANNDPVRGVIRASAVNQDGRTSGITQPSEGAQILNIQRAYAAAGLDTQDTSYFEAHGTGTALGDPLEARAIHEAFHREPGNPLYVGAIKANIGHLEAGAGMASLVKSVLVLENGIIPPIAKFKKPNPEIAVEEWNLMFPTAPIPFPTDRSRRISINNFGYGGTNAHVILDDAKEYLESKKLYASKSSLAYHAYSIQSSSKPLPIENGQNYCNSDRSAVRTTSKRLPTILLLSSADEDGIGRLLRCYDAYFAELPTFSERAERQYLADLAYTLNARRSRLPWKTFALVDSVQKLRDGITTSCSRAFRSTIGPCITLIFTGQGAQWHAMARGLTVYQSFTDSVHRSNNFLKGFGCSWDLFDEMHKDKKDSRVNEPEFSQPLCTALQIALVDLLESFGFKPVAVLGHSSGEIAAAYCYGALSQESAMKVAYFRGTVTKTLELESLKQGSMMAVALSEAAVWPYLEDIRKQTGQSLSIGCVNSPCNVTVTGDAEGIENLRSSMETRKIFSRKLAVNLAYHSYHMRSVEQAYRLALGTITSRQGGENRPLMFSTVTGGLADFEQISKAEYWISNLTGKVMFLDAFTAMSTHLMDQRKGTGSNRGGSDLLVEIGPHSALQRPIRDCMQEMSGLKNVEYDFILSQGSDPVSNLASFFGRVACRGHAVDLMKLPYAGLDPILPKVLASLPEYPFNHGYSYWHESRMSKNLRFRRHPKHDLLGIQEQDWNPMQPRWRNIIKLAENSWLRDHQLDGSNLFPASWSLVMAIEGVRQTSEATDTGTEYTLHDCIFPESFAIPEEAAAIEVQIQMRLISDVSDHAVKRCEFDVYAISKDTWIHISHGIVQAAPSLAQDILRKENERLDMTNDCSKSWKAVASTEFYQAIRPYGYILGPAFQKLRNLRSLGRDLGSAEISLDDWNQGDGKYPLASHLIHPIDLDAVLQTSVLIHSQSDCKSNPILVPKKIKMLRLSDELLNRRQSSVLRVKTKTSFKGFKEEEFSMSAVNENGTILLTCQGFEQTFVPSQALKEIAEAQPKKICYSISWQPSIDLLTRSELLSICGQVSNPTDLADPSLIDRQELTCYYFIKEALENADRSRPELPHLQRYEEWMQHQYNCGRLEYLKNSDSESNKLFGTESERRQYLDRFASESVSGKITVEVGRHLQSILNGKSDALDLLFSSGLASEFYNGPAFINSFRRLAKFVSLLTHKNPAMEILEIGAGTGGATRPLMDSLKGDNKDNIKSGGIPRFKSYAYTDVSPAFFEEAKRVFGSDRITYSTLDIEKNTEDQGYSDGRFDLIICSMVLHATSNLRTTLGNVRRLLKPGGKLALLEPTVPDTARVGFVFGLLPGWWLSVDEERKWSPLLNASDWNDFLNEADFEGVEAFLPDYDDPARETFGILLSTAKDRCQKQASFRTAIIIRENFEPQVLLANVLADSLSKQGQVVNIVTAPKIQESDTEGTFCICLVEIGASHFRDIDPDQWSFFKKLINRSKTVIWATQAAESQSNEPELNLVTGIARAVRSEGKDPHFIEVSLETRTAIERAVQHILKVVNATLADPESHGEIEYREQKGRLCIGRVTEAASVNVKVHHAVCEREPLKLPMPSSKDRALKLGMSSAGTLDTLRFDDDLEVENDIGPNEVEIEVKAAGVTAEDGLVATGRLAGDTLGIECAGIVSRAGRESGFKQGDKACCCTPNGAYKTFVRADASGVMSVPAHIPLDEAASMPAAFTRAYYALVIIANIQKGEKVLVHCGAEDVGQAAIQIAQRRQAHVLTTVRSRDEQEVLMELYSIPDNNIFSSHDSNFAQLILNTSPSGVDVVLNALSGHLRDASWACISPFGRFIDLGTSVRMRASERGLAMDPLANNVTFSSINLKVLMLEAKPLMKKITSGVSDLMTDSNPVRGPQPLQPYPLDYIKEAFQYVSSGNGLGKLVLDFSKGLEIPILTSTKPKYHFHEDAAYVIAGGLGGLGRAVVRWMVERKARNFILLSRSGLEKNEAAKNMIKDLQSRNVTIRAPCCDITHQDSVFAAIKACSTDLPPVRGCIQAAMVLKDALIDNISHLDFHQVIQPKVSGTINLRRALPDDLDFCVLLSSIASVTGSRGQASYAAANTFQDAFARREASLGRKCISLNLGSIMSVGFAAEKDMTAALRRDGFEGVSEAEFLAVMDYACDPACPAAISKEGSQLICGLAAAETLPPEHFQSIYWTSKPMFRPLIQLNDMQNMQSVKSSACDEEVANLGTALTAAEDDSAACEISLRALIDRLARLLAIPEQDVDVHRPLNAFGIDSLVALEIRNWASRELEAEIGVFEITSAESLESLAEIVTAKSRLRVKT